MEKVKCSANLLNTLLIFEIRFRCLAAPPNPSSSKKCGNKSQRTTFCSSTFTCRSDTGSADSTLATGRGRS